VDDTATVAIDTGYPSTPNPVDTDAITYGWTLGLLGAVIGDTEGSTEFTVAPGTMQDISVDVAVDSALSLVDDILVTVERETSPGTWETVQTFGSGGVLDLLGMANESLVAELDGLPEGTYRVTVENTSAVSLGGSVAVDISSSTTDLSQIVATSSSPATGNLLDDDTVASSFTTITIETGEDSFTEVTDTVEVEGLYGTLTLSADGGYSYAADPDLSAIGAEDVFTYQIIHPNGDIATATLTIDIEHGAGPGDFGGDAGLLMASSSISSWDMGETVFIASDDAGNGSDLDPPAGESDVDLGNLLSAQDAQELDLAWSAGDDTALDPEAGTTAFQDVDAILPGAEVATLDPFEPVQQDQDFSDKLPVI
jgi:VCBS repeat-containing protein